MRIVTGAQAVRPVLEARRLSKRYGARQAVDTVDLRLEEGEVVGLLGPNGAGKSTVLRCALGLVHPSAGSLRVFGQSPMRGDRSVMQRIGYVPERYALYPGLTGWEHLDLFARLAGVEAERRAAQVERAAATLGIGDRLEERVRRYSHGLRQRLVIAQALLGEPALLVLDEPTNGLDLEAVEQVRSLLRRMALGGTTVLLSSHRLQEVESVAGRVAIMMQGKVLQEGRLEDFGGGGLEEVYRRQIQEGPV